MRVVVSRLLLACAGFMALVLAFSLPTPTEATPLSLVLQGVYFLASIGSFVALFRIRPIGRSGQRLVAGLALLALLMLAFQARGIVAGLLGSAPMMALSSLLAASPWTFLLLVAALTLRRRSGALSPEQSRAGDYLRRKGTEAPTAEVRGKVEETFRELTAQLRDIPESSVRTRPRPGRWCVQEVVDHLVASHRPAMAELSNLLRGVSPTGSPIPASLQRPDVLKRDWHDLVDELAGVHGDIASLLAEAPEGPPGPARARVVMVVNAQGEDGEVRPVQWTEELDWKAYAQGVRVHVLGHAAQVRDILAELGTLGLVDAK